MNDKKVEKALSLAFFYLKFRSRTEKEIRVYLKKKAKRFKLNSEVIEETVNLLKEGNYINDLEFAKQYVEDRLSSSPRGFFLLKLELSRLGISKKIADKIVDSLDVDELELAKRALENRKTFYLNNVKKDRKKVLKKALDFLRRRGFPFDTSASAVKSVLNLSLHDEDDRSKIE